MGNEGVFIPRDYVDDREGAIQLTETMGLGGESWAILSQVHTPPTQRPGTASQDGPTLAHVFAEANLFHEVLHSTLPLVIAYPWSDSRFLAQRVQPLFSHFYDSRLTDEVCGARKSTLWGGVSQQNLLPRASLSGDPSPGLDTQLAINWMVVLQHVLLRTLCRSPQPFRNTALEGIHPQKSQKCCSRTPRILSVINFLRIFGVNLFPLPPMVTSYRPVFPVPT